MKIQEIRNLNDEELKDKLQHFIQELFNLRHQQAVSKMNNPRRVRIVKKTIARIKTVLQEREMRKNES